MGGFDYSLALREAVILHLQDDTNVTALIPELHILGVRTPANQALPFSRYDRPTGEAFEATGWDGSDNPVRLHVFAQGTDEVACSTICNAMVLSLRTLQMPGDLELSANEFIRQQVFFEQDEQDRWHGMIDFDMQVIMRDTVTET